MAVRIPIVLCGRTASVGQGVIQGLKPRNIEVIRFITSPERAISEIPSILSGRFSPPKNDKNLGTGNFSSLPRAIVLGGGYDEANVNDIRDACKKDPSARLAPLLLADRTTPTPPLGPEYGKALTKRAGDAVEALQDGKAKPGDLVWY